MHAGHPACGVAQGQWFPPGRVKPESGVRRLWGAKGGMGLRVVLLAGADLTTQRLNLRGSRPAAIAVALRGVGDTQMQRGHAPVRVPAHEVFREPARAGRPRLLPRRHALRDLRRDGRDKRGVVVLQGPLGGAAPTVYATRPSAPAFPTGRLQRPAGWEWAPVAAW